MASRASGTPDDADRLARRVAVALGREAGDLLLAGGRVVNVFTRAVEVADVVIVDGVVAGSASTSGRRGR